MKFTSIIDINDKAKEFGFGDIEEFSSGFLGDLKKAGWSVERKWISKKRPYKLEFNGSGNLDKVATNTDFYKMTKVSDSEYRIRFIPAESEGKKSSRTVTFKKRNLMNSAYFYDSNGKPVETISDVQSDKQYVIALNNTVQNKLIKQAKERGNLSDDEIAKKSIENYISSYLDENLKTLIIYDSDIYESIIQKVRKAPKQLQDEEFEKYLSEKISQLKQYEQNKRIKGTTLNNENTQAFFLQQAFGGGASLYDILYPEIKYEVMEIRDYSQSETIGCEHCDKMAFVRLNYQNLKNAPYLDFKKTTKIKSVIIQIYLSRWSNENTGWVGYKLLHFQPTDYKMELFNRNNSIAIREQEDREQKRKAEQERAEKERKRIEEEARIKKQREYEIQLAEQEKRRKKEFEQKKQKEQRIAALKSEYMKPSKTLSTFELLGTNNMKVKGEIKDAEILWMTQYRSTQQWKERNLWFGKIYNLQIVDRTARLGRPLKNPCFSLKVNSDDVICGDDGEIHRLYYELINAISKWYDKYAEVSPKRPSFLSKISNVRAEEEARKERLTRLSDGFSGKWVGTYNCGRGTKGITGLTLSISTNSTAMRATFNFYPSQQNSKAKSGSFYLSGRFSEDGSFILQPEAWINRPKGYRMIGMSGKVNNEFNKLESNNHSRCSFQLVKE